MKILILRILAISALTISSVWAQSLNVTASGNVGIGTATPTETLEVHGNIKVNDAVLSPAGSAPIFGCRAWVNFDGTRNAAGVVDSTNTARFIRGSGNVASVIRNSKGNYTITFTAPMPDENYSIITTTQVQGTSNAAYVNVVSVGSLTANSVVLVSQGFGYNPAADGSFIMAAIYR